VDSDLHVLKQKERTCEYEPLFKDAYFDLLCRSKFWCCVEMMESMIFFHCGIQGK
jgi:hypothetical protein